MATWPRWFRVRWSSMRSVTLSADEDLIKQARLVARSRKTTLNAAFREWLVQFIAREGTARDVDVLMEGSSGQFVGKWRAQR